MPSSHRPRIVYMVGNAHIDPVWLWRWNEGFQEIKATFRSALDRLKEYPDFIFTASSAAFYEWVESNDPDMFEEIQKRVKEGRWHICGGWWVEPDCNLPSGESFVRQGLYGQRYFLSRFGITASVGYNPDSFGHNIMIPQILSKSGMQFYVFMRPGPHEKELPSRLFWWKSPDGSSVLAYRIPYPYCTDRGDLREHLLNCIADEDLDISMCFYGVGNHGGGPTRRNIESIISMRSEEDLPELVFSSPDMFFNAVSDLAQESPVIEDELQHHASGCYSVHSGIKKLNRLAENRLMVAEKISSLANLLLQYPYPEDFDRAWKNVLFNQFHDILAATSIEPAYEDALYTYGESISIADRNLNAALQSISWKVNIEGDTHSLEDSKAVFVFNPHPWKISEIVEVESSLRKDLQYELVDASGGIHPFQYVKPDATTMSHRKICFVADVPAFGWQTYTLKPRSSKSLKEDTNPVTCIADDLRIETPSFVMQVDDSCGGIARLFDKRHNVEVFRSTAALPLVIADNSDTWSHGVFKFDDICGRFEFAGSKLVEHGSVKSVIRTESHYGNSLLVQEFTLYPWRDQIDVNVVVDWREKHKLLKLVFPVNWNTDYVTYEIPYGHITRPLNGEEEPGQSWVDISGVLESGQEYGLSLINDCKYSYSAFDNAFAITVLRSPVYAHHVPAELNPDVSYSYIDQGMQRFRYTLLPHSGSWRDARTPLAAALLNQPPIAIFESFHPGVLPPTYSAMEVSPSNVIVSVLKRAEDGYGYILRAYETNGEVVTARVRLFMLDLDIELQFAPYEIKTIKIDPESKQFEEVNLLEFAEGNS